MYIYTDLVPQFRCVMCGDCCRADWLVTVDEEGYRRNADLFARAGCLEEFAQAFVLLSGASPGEHAYIAKQPGGGCWFLEDTNRCRLHRTAGHNHLDGVCQLFPRYPMNTTRGCELTLSFSCPEVVRLASRMKMLEVIRSEQPPFAIPPDSFVAGVYPEQQAPHTPLRHYFELEHHFCDIMQCRGLPVAGRLSLLADTVKAIGSLDPDDSFRQGLDGIFAANYRLLDVKAADAPQEAISPADLLLENFFVNLIFKKIFYLYGLEHSMKLLLVIWRQLARARRGLNQGEDYARTRAAVMAAEFRYSHNRRELLKRCRD
ncbi:MAG: flagellin lysine-N-methylase [Negativicutes bacterium]|nr:flagellin lysine-N-methylase [Negativicutes bacterium]